jgi:hypothetical protein
VHSEVRRQTGSPQSDRLFQSAKRLINLNQEFFNHRFHGLHRLKKSLALGRVMVYPRERLRPGNATLEGV